MPAAKPIEAPTADPTLQNIDDCEYLKKTSQLHNVLHVSGEANRCRKL